MQDQLQKVSNFKIRAKRNFKDCPFSPLMSKEAKLQIERKVANVLGELKGNY